MNKLLAITLLSLFALSIGAKDKNEKTFNTYKVVAADELDNAIHNTYWYVLPRTKLNFEITVKQTQKKAGPFARYSERYLNLSEYITKDEENFELVSVKLNTEQVPDADQHYAILFENQGAVSLTNNPKGYIAAINEGVDFSYPSKKQEKGAKQRFFSFDEVPLTEDVLLSSSIGKMAEETAGIIKRIRENRLLLLGGDVAKMPMDGDSFNSALHNLSMLEEKYLSLFKGQEIQNCKVENVLYDPTSKVDRELLFRFSSFKGMVDKNDVSGSPVFMSIDSLGYHTLSNNTVEPVVDKKGRILRDDRDQGIIYRIPGFAHVTLTYKGKKIVSEKIRISQFGYNASLPRNIDISNGAKVIFYPCGAIQQLN